MALPSRHRFSVDEYHHMAAVGVLTPGDRVELLDGEVVHMNPIGSRHAACVRRIQRLFGDALRGQALVSVQSPVRLGPHSEPEPDVALLRFRDDDYADAHPGPADVFLLVEVADTTLAWDRRYKLPLYAASGVDEVWLVDLATGTVEISTGPAGPGYEKVRQTDRDGTVTPQAFPSFSFAVSDLLP